MRIGPWGWIAIVGGGAAALAALGGGASTPTLQGYVVGLPTSQPPKPDTPQGNVSTGDDSGRAWFTTGISRNEVIEGEMLVLSIENFADGTITADVFELVEPPDDVSWHEAFACGATRWRLKFEGGMLVEAVDTSTTNAPQPKCLAGARPIARAYLRTIRWVQRGTDVFVQVVTASGIWKHHDWPRPWGPGSQPDWRWDNDMVESGSVLVDVAWRVS